MWAFFICLLALPIHDLWFLIIMSKTAAHRHIGETNMNVYSSRSHTIFRMVCLLSTVLSVVLQNNIIPWILTSLITQVIESREKVDESEAGESCDAVRVSVLVDNCPMLKNKKLTSVSCMRCSTYLTMGFWVFAHCNLCSFELFRIW